MSQFVGAKRVASSSVNQNYINLDHCSTLLTKVNESCNNNKDENIFEDEVGWGVRKKVMVANAAPSSFYDEFG